MLSPRNIATIILNYNNSSDTLSCFSSLCSLPDRPGNIVVVDNHSDNNDYQQLLIGWHNICSEMNICHSIKNFSATNEEYNSIFLPLDTNTGFSAGNNAALRLLFKNTSFERYRAFWILNNDTIALPGALAALCKRLECGYGMVGSTILYLAKPDTVQAAAGCHLSPLTGATSFLLGGESLWEVLQIEAKHIEKKIHFITGASLLWERQCCQKIGLFPEEYFLYYEDAALGECTRRAGFSLGWAQDSLILHKEGGSTGACGKKHGIPKRSPFMDALALRNRYYFLRRYFMWWLPVAFIALAGVLAKRIFRRQVTRIPSILNAVLNGLRGKMGKPN